MIRLEYTRNNMQFLEALVLSCFHQISHVFHWETSSTLTHYNFEATADRYECSSLTCCNVEFGWIKMDRIMNKTYAHSTRTWHVNEEQLQNKVASLNRLMQVLQNSLMSEWYEKSDYFAMANSDTSHDFSGNKKWLYQTSMFFYVWRISFITMLYFTLTNKNYRLAVVCLCAPVKRDSYDKCSEDFEWIS